MSGPSRIVLAIFIDAFGWEILRNRPFVDDILTHRSPLDTVLGYSSTCDPSILTGRLPREHGHFSFYYYDPDNSPFNGLRHLGLLPGFVADRGRIRHWISKSVARHLGYSGYFQLYNMPFNLLPMFDYSEKKDIYQPGGINGRIPTFLDHFRARRVPFFLADWRLSETDNLQALSGALQDGSIRFAYLMMGHLDGIMHQHGNDHEEVDRKVRWYEEHIRGLVDIAHTKYDDVRVHVFSDHGMTNVIGTCDLMDRIDRLGLSFGDDYAAVYDSTMARFWFLRNGVQQRIIEALDAETYGRVLTDDELADYGCDFPDHRYGEVFFLALPGMLICPSFMGTTKLGGMHGYDPFHQDSVASYATNVETGIRPAGLTDLGGLLRREVEE